jgi:KaiC/GvpD/RAD55 family RecA-like ATPase
MEEELREENVRLLLVDFEPFVSRAAKRLGIPRVSLNHQDVMRACRRPDRLDKVLSFAVVKTLIRSYLPTVDLRIVSSFFRVPLPEGYHLVGPVFRREVLEARERVETGDEILVYADPLLQEILMRNFANIGLPMEELERSGRLRVACRYPEATSPEDLLVDLRTGLDEFKPSLVVLDSISSIEHSTSPSGFRQFMVGLASLLREHGRSALLTQTTALVAAEDGAAPYLSTICDSILLLDYSIDGVPMERSLRILKMRGSAHETARRRLSIIPGGLRVEPIGTA